ncbi:MAG: aldehyde dehydrogenase family protein [Candidatus Eisenbacteria bacterium]
MIESHLLHHRGGYIGGSWVDGSGESFLVTNPANGRVVSELRAMGRTETERAIAAAADALRVPSAIEDRRRWLGSLASVVREERAEIGRIITAENGKPLAEAEAEADYAAGFYEFAAAHVDHLGSRTLSDRPRNHAWTIHHRPAGVAGLITPWNFPFAMIAKKLAAALAGGAPSVIKPAEKTPLSMIALFTLLERIGPPAGMANLVFGDAPAIGGVLCVHPAVRVLSFTGSTQVGRLLLEQSAPHIKRVALELGGNAPYLVFEDADLELAANHLIQNKLRAGGQTCVCANRVLVARGVADAFTDRLIDRLKPLRVGDGMTPGVAVGPMIDRLGFEKVERHFRDAVQHGARCVYQGEAPERPVDPDAAGGWFFPLTVLRGVDSGMLCAREETFGPLFPLFEFADEDAAVAMANDTEYGLAAYLFTADEGRAERIISRLHYGHVGHNSGTGPTPEAPFGGMGHSGLGREGGLEGLSDFVELQTVARS